MGLPIISDFLITLNNHCFICLKPLPLIKSGSSAHSLQYLSRFLKLDLRKLFRKEKVDNDEDDIPSNLTDLIMTEVERSKLMAELCEGCASLNTNFVRLCRQFEKIKMEVTSQLSMIQREIMGAGEINSDKSEIIRGRLTTDLDCKSNGQDDELERSLEMADMLRKETILKCSLELKRDSPRIVIRKLGGGGKTEVPSGRIRSTSTRNSAEFASKLNRPLKTNISRYCIHLSSGRFKCKPCAKEFANFSSFYNHFRAQHLKVKFNCNVCFKTFSSKGNLKAHQESVHFGRRFFCKFCSKSMSSAANLTTHLRIKKCHLKRLTGQPKIQLPEVNPPLMMGTGDHDTHSEDKNSDPDAEFLTSPNTLTLETETPPPQVYDCSYNIVPKSEVDVHEIKMECLNLEVVIPPPDVDGDDYLHYCDNPGGHPLERPDPFTEPAPSEKNYDHLQPHSYACKICLRPFPSKSSLGGHMYQNHVRTNRLLSTSAKRKKNRKYKCAFCEKAFFVKSNYNRHYKTVHECLNTFKCRYCNYISSRQDNFAKHMQRMHPS